LPLFPGGVAEKCSLLASSALKCTSTCFKLCSCSLTASRRQCWDTGNTWNAESDATLDFFMDACARLGLKAIFPPPPAFFHRDISEELQQVSFHIEPYPGRSELTVRDDLMHIIHRFGQHKSLYRLSAEDLRPIVYIYDRLISILT
jgi:hypothetical protein